MDILQFFAYGHLPAPYAKIARLYCGVAHRIVLQLVEGTRDDPAAISRTCVDLYRLDAALRKALPWDNKYRTRALDAIVRAIHCVANRPEGPQELAFTALLSSRDEAFRALTYEPSCYVIDAQGFSVYRTGPEYVAMLENRANETF